jgi:polyhydroxyalkanoate synthesis regulator phasin
VGIIEDIMHALERIPVWKRVSALPKEVDELRTRIAALEAKLEGKPGQPEQRKFIGARV